MDTISDYQVQVMDTTSNCIEINADDMKISGVSLTKTISELQSYTAYIDNKASEGMEYAANNRTRITEAEASLRYLDKVVVDFGLQAEQLQEQLTALSDAFQTLQNNTKESSISLGSAMKSIFDRLTAFEIKEDKNMGEHEIQSITLYDENGNMISSLSCGEMLTFSVSNEEDCPIYYEFSFDTENIFSLTNAKANSAIPVKSGPRNFLDRIPKYRET